ncbi:DUF499 domain-containing protein [Candidatus Chloroploca sp. Khr17]|uniref:DUF499 domain-containing protein n=1 Tax=Candidatus Chloroploca sp. Khr17 TaxID=2496869 RepID=UPI00101D5D5C|nr:DUF499 domain-containing protein [Candidatus Chloroploca sp. Khr17]
MQPLSQLCHLRSSVFDVQRRDTVLDLTDLVNGSINPFAFFSENYVTGGMKVLLEQSFRRLEGISDQGVFKLKQAMGGGKTHNLLTLGLLARHPEYREDVLAGIYEANPALGAVKVVAFSGRESDAPLGIWGSIAEQLGKREHFRDCYAPLQAPGQNAWVNLLAGETVLILLDELPPYFQNARSRPIGNSDLAQVTATALSNLLVAIGKEPCRRVCLVISDLAASYQEGSAQLGSVLADFEKETNRSAMSLEPVRINSDELYHILRTRLFATLPSEDEIAEVAQAYARAFRDARQMGITNESPEQFANRIQVAYPFHPAIRDLYARFRENPGFQQTRGLIRLMRIVATRLWNSGVAGKRYLIAAHDLDLNDRDTLSEITQINSTLENAIAHDIASGGSAVAEIMDANLGDSDAQDACRLLLVSSLANVQNPVVGLAIPELVAALCAPGRDVSKLRGEVLEKLATAAWYLHSTNDGKLYFRDVQNLNAKLESLVRTYLPEQALKELRSRLEAIFKPVNGWCYQKVLALPAIDEIELEQDRVTLVISEPLVGGGLRPELRQFYEQTTWKNRVGFITGARNTYDQLVESGKRLRAIAHIIDELKRDRVPDSDPQMKQANELADRIRVQFYSAVRETFTILWYPTESGLMQADLRMRFEENRYSGEQQVVEVLREKSKYLEEVSDEMFRRKCEQRLFTTQVLPWSEVKRRAGMNSKWQWHHTDALDRLKAECIQRDIWREDGGFIDKGPFPQPKTNVLVQEQKRDDTTGEVILRVTPVHGELIYWEIGGTATTASAPLEGSTLCTGHLRLSFLAIDPRGVHEAGVPYTWTGRITLKHRFFQRGADKLCELQAAPPIAAIRYTTNGANPRVAGAAYDGSAFVVPHGAPFVLAYAVHDGIEADVERFEVVWEPGEDRVKLDPRRPAFWRRRHTFDNTRDSYEFLERMKRWQVKARGPIIRIAGEGAGREWLELAMFEEKQVEPELIEEALQVLRRIQTNGQVQFEVASLWFPTGQSLEDWAEEVRTTLRQDDIRQ